MTKVSLQSSEEIAESFNIPSRAHERYRQTDSLTDRRQTDLMSKYCALIYTSLKL